SQFYQVAGRDGNEWLGIRDESRRRAPRVDWDSADQLPDDSPVDVGQAEVAAGVAVGELLVVEAEEVEDRGVEVVDVDLVRDRGEAELVGGAVDVAAAGAAAGQPHRESVMVVVAAGEGRQLGDGCPAELAAPDHQHLVE